jgi:NTE family protein
MMCLLSGKAYSQSCDIRNLAFEGAGIRGIAYAGVIEVLEKNDKLKHVQKVGGTSAGALTALMVSLGYTSAEIGDIISSTQFRKFNDGRFMFFGGVARMNNVYGWYRGDAFTKWTEKIIEEKTANPEITFEELSSQGFKDLYITATSLSQQKLVVFSKENYPRMKVKDAVRISVSIPLYFRAVFVDSQGTVYKKPGKEQQLDVMVDGGIIGNFPITIFDSFATDSANNQHRIPNYQTIGVRIDSDQQIQHDAGSRELVPVQIRNLNDYMSALYILVIENLNRHELTDEDWARTIAVSSVGISPRVKRMSKEQKERLIQSGRDYTLKYISGNCQMQVQP